MSAQCTTAELRRVLFEGGEDAAPTSPSSSSGAAVPGARKVRFVAETQLVQGLQQPRRPPVLRAPDGKELVDNKMPMGANGEPLTLAYVIACRMASLACWGVRDGRHRASDRL